MNKASGGDGIPIELFQILKDDAVKVLHSICQQVWKTQQWPQDWKRSVFIQIPKKGNVKESSNYCTITLISHATAAAANSLQSCQTLYDPLDGSPPGSPVPGILQARTLEWVAISFSNAWKWKVKGKSLSRVWLLATLWTAAHQAPLFMDFPGKSTGVGCHCLKDQNCQSRILHLAKKKRKGKLQSWGWSETISEKQKQERSSPADLH